MKTYEYRATRHPDIFRVVDREGNWELYFHEPSKRYLRSVSAIIQKGYAKDYGFYQFLSQHTQQERDEILRSAGDKGDMVHRAIETILFGEITTFDRSLEIHNRLTGESRILNDDEWDALLSWAEFWKRHEPMLVSAETTVFNLKEGYAGTLDAILVLTKACDTKSCPCNDLVGKKGLYDWKSGGGIYPNYSAQTAAYARSDNVSAMDYTAIVRLGTSHKTTGGYQFQVSLNIAGDFKRFLAAKEIADYDYVPFDPEKEIKDVPDVIEVVVKKFDELDTKKLSTKNIDKTIKAYKTATKKPRAKKDKK